MLNKIIHFSITNKLVIGIGTLALIIWGIYSFKQLPIDAVPDITNNQVQVITTAPSSGAEEIERYVTFPIEQTMASIPEIEEIRSFSRFGLSVVTLVFQENTDIYWAREQVAQRLQEAKNAIPAGLGEPGMAPVSTGLGEIYQYIIKPSPGYEKKYGPAELRTIQDWLIRRQLLGTPGVADVSGFGGYLKQYEVAIKPEVLRSFGISLTELFTALENNNANTGGAYISKAASTYYIRSEGITTNLDDIRDILVKTVDGKPITVNDLAIVRYGKAIRYGALTDEDKGEAVGGIVLMLKDANASKVILDVKERMAQVQKTLPKGVEIEVYLDRTKLVNKAIHTVSTNLVEGALIVIFILVLLLGNIRAGLIVASVIPLAMLFAISMMNVFGVSGNLMSLGAIDFGLIVDGAVIIVEATLHHLVLRKSKHTLSQAELNDEVEHSAKKIMKSAAFGEIIILIVYLPLLTLVGIEGKMFAPMAQTVIFAIIGAFILSLTYVPMISSLVLSKKANYKDNISDKLMRGIQRIYKPAQHAVIRKQKWAILSVLGMFIVAITLFMNLGAEFIPTLDEGDFAVEVRAATGSNLEYTVDVAKTASRVLKKSFPDEIITCVGKIGTAEIPTDPMPMEACDLMIILKDKEHWKKATNREDLATKMQARLDQTIPGVSFSFQQPIQMRFNEMMAGAKQDVVVKVYGEDLEKLSGYAKKIGGICNTIKGATDVYVEEVTGLPQIIVRYNRKAMARYNVSVSQVNSAINMGFAGQPAGQIYEGEKRFDLVVRLDEPSRQNIKDLENLTVLNNEGVSIPIGQVAEVKMENGPNQIQRDDAKRRIIVGFNVRGRDVESIVTELQKKVDQNVRFESGYYTAYSGSYKNLEKAKARLGIAVPVSLFLIVFLLYMTFSSIKQALLIFSAIPLAAIGGILALWLRDMPFSISAGVGFIALFGVAVLNGIVLVAEFNHIRKEQTQNLMKVILLGTQVRLRPVLMTAMVASLGFLPMAISTGSGAEVQKPLATVVIGGLISATFLTLFLLPIMYRFIEKTKPNKKSKGNSLKPLSLLFIGVLSAFSAQSQSLESCIQQAVEKNKEVEIARLVIEQSRLERKALLPISKTQFTAMVGQYNSINHTDNNFTVQQTIPFPSAFSRQKEVSSAHVSEKENALKLVAWTVEQDVRAHYEELSYYFAQRATFEKADSLYQRLEDVITIKQKSGEVSLMELNLVRVNRLKHQQQVIKIDLEIRRLQNALQLLMHADNPVTPSGFQWMLVAPSFSQDSSEFNALPQINQYIVAMASHEAEAKFIRSMNMPDITLGYFNQTLIGTQNVNGQDIVFTGSHRFQGASVGVAIPIFSGASRAQQAQKQIDVKIAETNAQYEREKWRSNYTKIKTAWDQYQTQIVTWNESVSPKIVEMTAHMNRSFSEGDIAVQLMLMQQQLVLEQNNEYNLLVLNANLLAHQLIGFQIK